MARFAVSDGAEGGGIEYFDASGNLTASTVQKASGSYSYYLGANGWATKNIPAATEFWWRGKWRISTLESAGIVIAEVRNSTTVLFDLLYQVTTGLLEIRNGAGTILATTTGYSMAEDTWYQLELHVKIDGVAGVVALRVDKIDAASYTGNTGSTAVDNLKLRAGYANTGCYFDDLAFDDAAWLGSGCIVAGIPNGNGSASDWLGNDGNKVDNYLLTDELPADGDTTYLESSTPGEQDLVDAVPTLPADATITAVWVELIGEDPAAGAAQVKPLLRSNAATTADTAQALLGTYGRLVSTIWATNPNTAAPWVAADLTGMEIGVEAV